MTYDVSLSLSRSEIRFIFVIAFFHRRCQIFLLQNWSSERLLENGLSERLIRSMFQMKRTNPRGVPSTLAREVESYLGGGVSHICLVS